jgi:sugar lactone lactonase YvrE
VTPDGDTRIVADGVAFPNGMAITADGSTLIVAESFASRLGAWDIESDGSLSNRRVWATVEHGVDGICIDAEDAVWCSTQRGCARVREGGEVAESITHDLFGFSCALGGRNGRTLFMVANEWHGPENIGKGPRTGRVDMVEVDVPAPR